MRSWLAEYDVEDSFLTSGSKVPKLRISMLGIEDWFQTGSLYLGALTLRVTVPQHFMLHM